MKTLEEETKEICPLIAWCLEEFTGHRYIFNCVQSESFEKCVIYKSHYKDKGVLK